MSHAVSRGEDMIVINERTTAELAVAIHQSGHERKFMRYRLHPVDYVRLGDGLVVEERCRDWGLIVAGVIEPHHPGLAGAEVVNFEVGIAALETHALARRSIFTLAGSSQGRNQERRQHIVQPRVLPGLARDHTFEDDSIVFLVQDSITLDGESPDGRED